MPNSFLWICRHLSNYGTSEQIIAISSVRACRIGGTYGADKRALGRCSGSCNRANTGGWSRADRLQHRPATETGNIGPWWLGRDIYVVRSGQ